MSGPLAGPRLWAVAELRALLFWRRLRSRGGTAEGVATALLFLLALPAALIFAGLLALASHRALQGPAGTLRSDVTVTALLFGVWQAWTAVSLAVAEREAASLDRTLRYPVAPGKVYALGLASGVAGDPFAAFWLVLLGGAFAGAALARPGAWLLLLAAVLAAFAAATVALVALVQELLARAARWRHFRELAILAGVAGWVLLLSSARTSLAAALPLLRRLQWALFPPALASAAARHLYAGRAAAALPWLAALGAAAALSGWLAYRLALATALSGGEEGRPAAGAGGVRAPRLLPERLGPLFEKELRYLLRHPVARINLVLVPAFAAFLAWKVVPLVPEEAGEVVRALPLLGLAAWVHLVLQPFWLNAFGWDGGGARALFLAPLSPAAVLRAKNAAVATLSGLVFLGGAAVFVALAGWPPAWAAWGAAALHAGLAPLFHAAGNVVSILNPRAAGFALQRGGSVPALSSLAGMAIVSGGTALFGLPVLAALYLDLPWALVGTWVALAAAGWAAWARTLPAAGRLLLRRREEVLAAVATDRG